MSTVKLIPLAEDHADILLAWAQDRELSALTGAWPDAPDELQMRALVQSWMRSPEIRSFMIQADGELIGNAWLGHIDGRHASLGIAIGDPNGRGRGFGTEAMYQLLEHAADLEEVTLWVFADNAPGIAVYRKVGFIETGRGYRDGREIIEMAYPP